MDHVEKRLVNRIKEGDHRAFEEIVELYKEKIYQLSYRMLGNREEAEDAAQETFLRVYSNIGKYDDNHKFSTWIYRIASNLCIDRIRKRKPQYSLDAELSGTDERTLYATLPDRTRTPEEEAISGELQQKVQQAILSLSPTYRSIMILKYIHDLSLKEISEIVDLPVSTVKTRIHRGREALRKVLGDI
ncbi:MAG: RNA polymerase sigma factor SigW [Bacillaceae bacterium]|nr:RNA polymerase sigma factor SigW [Bacillaceae bacterium]